ncbi:hypothetical protein GCM10007216_36650 [Thalassobacillus devorans]|uniref:Tyrosinase copper-binding domain-containing protein n=1 Tax=Thalassobacillus devorans TaxID=279813 RepID=A0ABQ1PSA9_9BACI|nr:hypothetical protein GCM10007216_36650 [Thalassobacillus devorans]
MKSKHASNVLLKKENKGKAREGDPGFFIHHKNLDKLKGIGWDVSNIPSLVNSDNGTQDRFSKRAQYLGILLTNQATVRRKN